VDMIGATGLMGAVVAVPVGGVVVAPDDGVKEGIDGGFVVGFVEITGELVGVPGRGCTTGFPLMIEDGEVLKFLISLCICWGYSKQS
jgi:hypothetical protein